MQTGLLLRGSAGVGKSTLIDNLGLTTYKICPDDIRLLYQSPQQDVNGLAHIGFDCEKEVWKTAYELLEARMQRGEFFVFDATCSKAEEINRIKKLGEQYRYRLYIIDMTDVPIEECKRRNKSRIPLKQVPEEVIDKFYARFKTQKIPSGVTVIKPDEVDKIWHTPIDLSGYRKIVHIGDIHGCNSVLQEYLKNGIEDDVCYIFIGDYIDRGIENVEVIKFLMEIKDKKNVILLKGNHERWLKCFADGVQARSREFELVTRKQFDEAKVDKKDISRLYQKFAQCAWYYYHEKEVFVCHGGIATFPEKLTLLATE